uniref:Lipid droplet-associated hydrolase n=1 Tax=Panagrolaimus sp. PS1159 TaxID=55785 RepID=A0AC35G0Q5_9BILA
MTEIEKNTEWIKVAHKYTRITWQKNYIPKLNQEAGLIFVMIPGNPGNEKFYEHFGQRILEKIPIILMGHSIGSYMALKIFPQLIENGFNVVKLLCLFPGIEQLALSSNGKRNGRFLEFFDKHSTLTKIPLSFLWFIPNSFKRFIVRLILRDPLIPEYIPECVIESTAETISSSVTQNIIHLANNEFQIVKNHDDTLFPNEYRDRIILYYGKNDGWVPESCVEEQIERLGKSCVFLDNNGSDHEFVNLNGDFMAKTVVSLFEPFFKTLL